MIELQRFCENRHNGRHYLSKPWRSGQWVFATNGHIALRVPASGYPDAEEGEHGKVPDLGGMFARNLEWANEFLLVPPVGPVDDCHDCGGKGRVFTKKCPDCEGGTFMHGNYEYACQNCEGSAGGAGRIVVGSNAEGAESRACDYCDGLGKILRLNGYSQIGEASYSKVYLEMIAQLPQARICPGDPAADGPTTQANTRPAVFIFDGGHGLLMPTKP